MNTVAGEYIYGIHPVQHALDTEPGTILVVCYLPEKRKNRRLQKILDTCRRLSINCQEMSASKMDTLTNFAAHQGLIARYAPVTGSTKFEDLCQGTVADNSIILALDCIQDPQNLGACIRTANAAGVTAVVLPKDKSAPVNATVRKVASGAVENTAIHSVTNLARALKQLQDAGYWVLGTAEDAPDSILDFNPDRPLVLVMGAEESGLRHNTRKQCDFMARIPMHGEIASLNVSVATGVCLFQLRSRQPGMTVS